MTIVKTVNLGFTAGTSDKVYNLQIEDLGNGTYEVNAYYGRRGANLNLAPQGSASSLAQAEAILAGVANKKTAKGYKVEGTTGVQSATTAPTIREKMDTGMRPQLLNPIALGEADTYINDDAYCMQIKYDGERLLIGKSGSDITAANRKGFSAIIPTNLEDELQSIPDNFEIDGEIVDGNYFVFDLLWKQGDTIDSKPYSERYKALSALLAKAPLHVVAVNTFFSQEDKINAFAQAKRDRREGVVFKLLSAPFTAGRPNSGGPQLKCKFWESATCIVTAVNKQSSIALGLLDGGSLVSVGNVTVKANQATPAAGDIVEVKYLYMRSAGGALYQPELLAIRDDVDRDECTVDQIKLRG